MASATPRLTLSPSRDIPFNKLRLSQANVRRIKAEVSIEELAEDIARRGLIQSLNVRPILDADGAETGMYEVPAGGRRFRRWSCWSSRSASPRPPRALHRARRRHRHPRGGRLPRRERPARGLASARPVPSLSSAAREGAVGGGIAAAFFVPASVVKQRLKLASVSPALLAIYAEDGMTLEQLIAFAVSNDHQRQEQVWEAVRNSWSKEPYQIRRMLTEKAVRASDKRARLIGVEAYEAAGGTVSRDLFQNDDGGWCDDPALLDRLVTEKLKAEAATIAAEGWRWIEVAAELPYGHTHGLRRIDGQAPELTEEERQELVKAQEEYDALVDEHHDADELPEEVDARLGELEAIIAGFEERPVVYHAEDIAVAGAFVSLKPDGTLAIERGYVRPEDERKADAAEEDGAGDGDPGSSDSTGRSGPVITVAGEKPEADPDEDDVIRPLPDRLVLELTAHRTLALRDAVAQHPEVALTLLLHRLVTDAFNRGGSGGCLEASVRHLFFPVQAPDLKDSPRRPASRRATRAGGRSWQACSRAAMTMRSGAGCTSSTPPAASRFWRIASPTASTRFRRRSTAMAGPASAPMASTDAWPRRTGWPRPSSSTWSRRAGVRRKPTTSPASPSPASSRR